MSEWVLTTVLFRIHSRRSFSFRRRLLLLLLRLGVLLLSVDNGFSHLVGGGVVLSVGVGLGDQALWSGDHVVLLRESVRAREVCGRAERRREEREGGGLQEEGVSGEPDTNSDSMYLVFVELQQRRDDGEQEEQQPCVLGSPCEFASFVRIASRDSIASKTREIVNPSMEAVQGLLQGVNTRVATIG